MALSKLNNDSFADTAVHGRRNLIINGAIQVAQRGTSDTTFGSGYSVDRMFLDQFSQTGDFHTYQQLSSDPPVGFTNYLRWQRNSGRTDTGAMRIYYTGESGYSDGIAGNKLTLSFYARSGSDYSGGSLQSMIVLGEGTNQTRSSWANGNWTNQVNDSQNNTLTTSWQQFTHTLASAAGNDVSQHALRFVWTPTGTAGTNDYIEITGIQLEVGDKATPFEHRSYAEELVACQRYTWKLGGFGSDQYFGAPWLYFDGNNVHQGPFFNPVQMRGQPSMTQVGSPVFKSNGGAQSGFTFSLQSQGKEQCFSIQGAKTGHGLSNVPTTCLNSPSTSDYFILDAEL